MRSLQQEILELLGDQEVNVDEIVRNLAKHHPDLLEFDIRSALLPLLATGLVEWTKSDYVRATNAKVLAIR